MKPGSLPLRVPSRPVCQLCDYILQQPVSRRAFLAASTLKTPSTRRQNARTPAALPRIYARRIQTSWRNVDQSDFAEAAVSPQTTSDSIVAVKERLAAVEAQIRHVFDSNKVESEATICEILDGIEEIAHSAIAIRSRQPLPTKATIRQSSAGAILSGFSSDEAPKQRRTSTKPLSLNELPTPTYLSKLAEGLLKHPNVFVGRDVLTIYIRLQRLLNRAHAIPEILYLYANKPVPQEGSSPPKFSTPSPKAPSQAIPEELAEESLTAAIEAKDMALALSVIDHTYRTPAWTRRRMLTKMGLPGVLTAMAPLAIYMIAQEMSVYSGLIDPWTFKMYAFAGISTYVLCTGTLGFVALTTYNDDHDRVVWRPGVPLLDRYIRADERAALDRIACAWGFKELWKRGDEEGEDWEGLRQLCLLRGMQLDRPELMPGIIDRECVVAAPLWHACRLPQYITIMKKTNEPPEPLSEERLDDELAAEDSDDGLHDYEATQLGKSFLEEMQRVDPAWLQIHDEAATKRELMLAIEVTVNGANLPHVNEWLDSIFEGKKLEMTLTESISDHLKYD